MLKTLTISASVLGFVLAGPAVAQNADTPPAAPAEVIGTAPAGNAKDGKQLFIPEQATDQVLANSIIGAEVVDVGGTEVGKVKDLILDKDGNAVGVVVSWGGVLGIGGKAVGISFGPAQVHEGEEPQTKLVRLNMTKDAVEAGPEFMDTADKEAEAARTRRSTNTGNTSGGMN